MTNVFKHIVKIILVIDFCKVICITIRYCENRKECILISLMQSDKMHKNKYSNNIKKDMYVRKKKCIKICIQVIKYLFIYRCHFVGLLAVRVAAGGSDLC